MSLAEEAPVIPDHVDPALVFNLPIGRGLTTDRLPHDIVSDIHRNYPRAFYAPNLMNGGGWVFPRAEDQRRIWQDAEHFSSQVIQPFAELAGGDWNMIPIEQDPPQHTRYRKLLNPFFTPKALAPLNNKIRGYARSDIAKFAARGSCEFMFEFAFAFPIKIFLEMMDMPIERTNEFLDWEMTMMRADSIDAVADAVKATVNYLQEEINTRRGKAGEGFISSALNAEIDGQKLTDSELMGLCFNLFLGGLDTVSAHLGHMFRYLAENPDEQSRIRRHPELIDGAIDEMMRAFGAVTITRTCVKPTSIADTPIRAGERVAISSALAARDPIEYEDPDKIDFNRKSRSLSFGTGPHLCIGMHLAKYEIRCAIEEFLAAIPQFHLAPDARIESDLGTIMMPLQLPLEW